MTVNRIAGAIVACALVLVPLAPSLGQSSATRTYQVQGTNPNGSGYSGTVQVVQTGAQTYRVQWRVGGAPIPGIGMSAGNIFSAAYVLQGKAGLVIYQIMPNGVLQGQWSVADSNGVGTETWTPAQ